MAPLIVCYGCDTRYLTLPDKAKFKVFVVNTLFKVLNKIYGNKGDSDRGECGQRLQFKHLNCYTANLLWF